ncbi:MAG: polysaccharide deacetylase family protein [Actinomycetota bacterium]
MRATPAMLVLTLLTAVVIGGSWWLGRDRVETARAGADPDQPAQALEPTREVAALALPDPLPQTTVDVPILLYQRVSVVTGEEEPALIAKTVEAQEFQLQLEWLKGEGYEAISLLELYKALMEGGALPDKPIVLAFMGGYRGTASVAAPRMADAEMIGVVCSVTGKLPRRRAASPDRLTWGMLRELEARGWDIASETTAEEPITGKGAAEAPERLTASQAKLEKILGHPVQWLCSPGGAADASAAEAARAAGYVLGIAAGEGTDQSAASPLELRAIPVDNKTGVRDLTELLRG